MTHKIEEHCLPVRALAYDSQNKKLISASDDLHINILDAESYKINLSLVGHKDLITGITVNSVLNIYASCSHDGSIKIWDGRESKAVRTLHVPVNEESNCIWDIHFTNDGKYLVAGSEYGVHILNI